MKCFHQQAVEKFPGNAVQGWRWYHRESCRAPGTKCGELGGPSGAFVRFCDRDYPQPLRRLESPPLVLYRATTVPLAEPCVAIVGTREADGYARGVSERLGRFFGSRGWSVISGEAHGVDEAALRGVVSVGGQGVVVLGTSFQAISSRKKRRMGEILDRNGQIFSEVPEGCRTAKHFFLQRNRIVASLADVVIVVAARRQSGSLSTARWAMNLGKPVFAVPGDLHFDLSEGTNELIGSGKASALIHPGRILECFSGRMRQGDGWPRIRAKRYHTEEEAWLAHGRPRKHSGETLPGSVLETFEKRGPLHPEELAPAMGWSIPKTTAWVQVQLLQGTLVELAGGRCIPK